MSSEFNEFRHIKKTRKPQLCIICGRLIPPGHKAHNFVGENDGEFQNWYLCDYCYENILYTAYGEYISNETFDDYFVSNLPHCPNCDGTDRYWGDCDSHRFTDKSSETLKCKCSKCKNEYFIKIPFDAGDNKS